MTIENINSVQPIVNNTVEDVKHEEEVKSIPQSKGSSKDVIAVLSALAAIGAAGIAIYKHKNTKKAVEEAVKKAEDEAKKKIEEAEAKAKKAAEDVEKRIQEAVDKATKKSGETGGSAPAPKTPDGGSTPKPSAPASAPADEKPSIISRVKNWFKRKPKSQSATEPVPMTPAKQQQSSNTIFQPLTPRVPGQKPVPAPSGVTAEDKPSFGQRIRTRIKNLLTRKNKNVRRHQDDAEPQAPAATGTPSPAPAAPQASAPQAAPAAGTAEPPAIPDEKTSIFARIKNIFRRKPKAEVPQTEPTPQAPAATGTPSPAPAAPQAPAPQAAPAAGTAEPPAIPDEKTSIFARIKNIFRRKPKAEVPQTEPTPQAPAATGTPSPAPAAPQAPAPQLAPAATGKPTPTPAPAPQGTIITNPKPTAASTEEVIAAPKPEIKPTPTAASEEEPFEILLEEEKPSVWARIKNVFKRKPKVKPQQPAAPVAEPAATVVEKPIIVGANEILPDVTIMSEQQLLADYNSLKKVVMGLPAADPTAQRFLEIQGELFNHRGYRFQNGELVKTVKKAEPKPEVKEVGKAASAPKRSYKEPYTMSDEDLLTQYKELSQQNLPVFSEESNQLQGIKDELIRYRGYEVQNGQMVKTDITKMSDQSLMAIYKALMATEKKAPGTTRFLEIQGELFNHRGYRFLNGELVKKAEPKVEMTPEIAQYVAGKEAQLNGNIMVNVPKKPTNYQHKQIQKEYDEMARKLDQEAKWKENARSLVAEKEAELSGRINVEVNFPKRSNHDAIQKEYNEKLGYHPIVVKPRAEGDIPKIITPVTTQVKGLVDRNTAEFKGLTEVEALQLEHANCDYVLRCISGLNDDLYRARMAEIETELTRLGEKVNPELFTEGAMNVRRNLARTRVSIEGKTNVLKELEQGLAASKAKLSDLGITVKQSPEEMILQDRYLTYKRWVEEGDNDYKKRLDEAVKGLKDKGYTQFEVKTDNDKAIVDYMASYRRYSSEKNDLESLQAELTKLTDKLQSEVSKKK